MDTIYTKIWNALKLAEDANVGVSFDAREALELMYILDYYSHTIIDLEAENKRLHEGLIKIANYKNDWFVLWDDNFDYKKAFWKLIGMVDAIVKPKS